MSRRHTSGYSGIQSVDSPDMFDNEQNRNHYSQQYNQQQGGQGFENVNEEEMSIETQKTLLKTFEIFYEKESETMLTALEKSRDDIKSSMIDLLNEQERYKEELEKMTNGKYAEKPRKKENAVPLSEYLRKKKGLSSSSASSNGGSSIDQHPSDKLAVEKYLRKKERQQNAEMNRKNRELNEEEKIELETHRILEKLQGVDQNVAKERDRQMEKIQSKLKGRVQTARNDQDVANEMIENYHDTELAFEREKRLQQEKFLKRLSAARERKALVVPNDYNRKDNKGSLGLVDV